LEAIPRPVQAVQPQPEKQADEPSRSETLSSLQGRLKALLNRKKRF
jgi:hypothetical protein